MRRFWGGMGALLALLAAAMAATLLTPLGVPLWHYNASFLLLLVALGASWRLLQRRRVATMTMAVSGALAVGTGFAMLYTIQFPYKEWLTWWHCFTSFALLLAFLVHWLHNHPRLMDFTRRLLVRERVPGYAATGAWALLLAGGAWLATPAARGAFTSENYVYLSTWAVLVGIVFTYGLWLAYRLPAMQARLARPAHRNRARALIDTSLFLSHWAALLTGFALLYFAEPLRAGPLKYVSKWWHTATSVAFLALVVIHVGFNARLLAAHARRLDDDLRSKNA
ncbi:MAG TPA: hypothetical protein VM582_02865 [Candidatus Thermoplasmatota archaeon]|nr:hypothetical protein [Candidatus Thermoplasmatota archaeon]